ncbi:hypothetical protein M758_UG033500 [Ceratodon purpureus]|nr:hypothetical protein M758_UG033500 [Ceratodon purpureus]
MMRASSQDMAFVPNNRCHFQIHIFIGGVKHNSLCPEPTQDLEAPYLCQVCSSHFRSPVQGGNVGPVTPPQGTHRRSGSVVQPVADESEKGKQCRWSDTKNELLLEWLELPGHYELWKAAGLKGSGGSTNPSGVSKSKMENTVIHKYLVENGV